jgi:SAM-dependent methyltransferase
MFLHDILADPRFYGWKSRVFSLGRRSVRDYLAGLPPLPAGARVLDVACGPGIHAGVFGAHVRYTGVDLSPPYVTHAARRHGPRFLRMDAARMAFPDGVFAFVFCTGACHHMADETVLDVAREMKRVAAPGARVLVIDAVYPGPRNPLGRLLARMDRGGHVRPPAAMTELMARAGFDRLLSNLPGSYPYQRAVYCSVKA